MADHWAWMKSSACQHSDPTMFDNDKDDEYPPEEVKRICVGCPVRTECLTLHIYDFHGIWGGTTSKQREVLRREHTQVTCPSCKSKLITKQGDTEICLGCGISWISRVIEVKL